MQLDSKAQNYTQRIKIHYCLVYSLGHNLENTDWKEIWLSFRIISKTSENNKKMKIKAFIMNMY